MSDWAVATLPIFMELLKRVHPRDVHVAVRVHHIVWPEYRRKGANAGWPLENFS